MVCEREGEMFQEKETDGKQIAEESKSRTDVKIIEQQVCSSPFSPFFFFFSFSLSLCLSLSHILTLSFAHSHWHYCFCGFSVNILHKISI